MEDYKRKAEKLGVPLIPPLAPESKPFDPNPVIAVCGECGREIRQVEGYWCPSSRCPTQVRFT